MESQENVKASHSRALRIVKWGCLGLVLVAVAAGGGLGFLVIPDLLGAVPTPEAVVRVERQAAGQDRVSKAKSGVQTDDEQSTAALSDGSELARQIGPLIQDDPGIPKAVAAKRDELNREFAAVLRELERLDAETARLPYEETKSRLTGIRRMCIDKVWRPMLDNWKAGDSKRYVPSEPSYQPIWRKQRQFIDALDRIGFENLVRHGKWAECAILNEFDQWEKWPQAVYYWRRLGGWDGYKHIIGGSIYVRTRNYPSLDHFRKKYLAYAPE